MDEKIKDITILAVGVMLAIIFAYFALQRQIRRNLVFFWSNSYYYIVYIFSVIAFIILFLKLSKKFKMNEYLLRIVYGLIFLPVALFPIFRCYFKIPYVFCRSCPNKCPWGELRSFIVPSFLVLNLDKRLWCFKLCPFGTLQDSQCKVSNIRIRLPMWLRNIRYILLALIIIIILTLIFKPDYYFGLFRGNYHFSLIVLITALAIFTLSFFIPRFWCNYFCPIGTFSDLILKLGVNNGGKK